MKFSDIRRELDALQKRVKDLETEVGKLKAAPKKAPAKKRGKK